MIVDLLIELLMIIDAYILLDVNYAALNRFLLIYFCSTNLVYYVYI